MICKTSKGKLTNKMLGHEMWDSLPFANRWWHTLF